MSDPKKDLPEEAKPEAKSEIETASSLQRLRVWPVVLLLGGMIVCKYLHILIPDGPAQLWMSSAFGPLACGVMLVIWWGVASRASMSEKVIGILGLAVAVTVVAMNLHETMRGPALLMVTIPMGMAAFGLGAILLSRHLTVKRTIYSLLLAVVGFGFSLSLRSDGMWGGFDPIFDWRWNRSAEEQFLAEKKIQSAVEKTISAEVDSALANPAWSGFRGNDRSGIVSNLKIDTDWKSNPPDELWRINVGPGWGSFAVAGDLLFTQEQRGEQECVVCYDATSGAEYWRHEIETRFWDPLGGPGPRATPTLSSGKLFAMGANGILSCLDAKSGHEQWAVDLRKIVKEDPPMWGFSASPLVTDKFVVTYGAGAGEMGIIAFGKDDGEMVWNVAAGRQSYSSPHLCRIHDRDFICMTTDAGIEFVDAESGKLINSYEWKQYGYRALQPFVIDNDSVLLATGMGAGTRRIRLEEDLSGSEVWTTMALKPDFNDLVVHEGYIYGFDQTVFACVDIATGERKWKGGRYGKGQALLVRENGVVLVLTEKGDVVLVEATPEKHRELGKVKAFSNKTWNHPVLVGDRLYVRNDREAICYRLKVLTDESASRSREKDSLCP